MGADILSAVSNTIPNLSNRFINLAESSAYTVGTTGIWIPMGSSNGITESIFHELGHIFDFVHTGSPTRILKDDYGFSSGNVRTFKGLVSAILNEARAIAWSFAMMERVNINFAVDEDNVIILENIVADIPVLFNAENFEKIDNHLGMTLEQWTKEYKKSLTNSLMDSVAEQVTNILNKNFTHFTLTI